MYGLIATAPKATKVAWMDDAYIVSFERYLRQEKARQPSTVKAYLKAVRAFQGWLGQEGLAASSVEAADITKYLEARKAAPSYQNSVLGALRVWYDHLGELGQVHHNPARELSGVFRRPSQKAGTYSTRTKRGGCVRLSFNVYDPLNEHGTGQS